ncbi:class E sortase [Kocuria dechangensis]|uniref:class E sortase n=1 Tax=Kocuria dechangensis TaxID=1176249 RepID=UPI0016688A96|nr:class E sortase [Kocuria dechangensis]
MPGAWGRIARAAGELLITIGLLVVLFVVWQLWWTNIDATETQQEVVAQVARELDGAPAAAPPAGAEPAGAEPAGGEPADGAPPETAPPGYGEPIGIVYVPRFGKDYARPLIQGTGADVLDTLGLGHYPSTAMPGQVGNFAVAGHRQSNGKVLDLIHTLEPGDRIHVRTAEGYYTYAYRNGEIVAPTETRVLAPVPSDPGAAATERLLTLTTCHPRFGDTERFIGYAVLESWRPATAGPPAEITGTVAAGTETQTGTQAGTQTGTERS